MGSGIVGYLHQFPLGRRGSGERRRVGLFPPLTFHRLAGPLALPFTYMIMKCHIFHSSGGLHFKGQEQCALSAMQRRRRAQAEPQVATKTNPALTPLSLSSLLLTPVIVTSHTHTQKNICQSHIQSTKTWVKFHCKGIRIYNTVYTFINFVFLYQAYSPEKKQQLISVTDFLIMFSAVFIYESVSVCVCVQNIVVSSHF